MTRLSRRPRAVRVPTRRGVRLEVTALEGRDVPATSVVLPGINDFHLPTGQDTAPVIASFVNIQIPIVSPPDHGTTIGGQIQINWADGTIRNVDAVSVVYTGQSHVTWSGTASHTYDISGAHIVSVSITGDSETFGDVGQYVGSIQPIFYGTVTGTVEIDAGEEYPEAGGVVGGATVQLINSGGLHATAVTGADGSYSFDRVKYGGYNVLVTLPAEGAFTVNSVAVGPGNAGFFAVSTAPNAVVWHGALNPAVVPTISLDTKKAKDDYERMAKGGEELRETLNDFLISMIVARADIGVLQHNLAVTTDPVAYAALQATLDDMLAQYRSLSLDLFEGVQFYRDHLNATLRLYRLLFIMGVGGLSDPPTDVTVPPDLFDYIA